MTGWGNLSTWLGGDFSYRLVVTLMHFLWQAAVLGFLAHVVTLGLRGRSARHAYGVNVAFLMCMVLVAAITYVLVESPQPASPTVISTVSAFDSASPQPASSPVEGQTPPTSTGVVRAGRAIASGSSFHAAKSLSSWSSPIAACYLGIVGFLLLRVGCGSWRVYALRGKAISIDRVDLLELAERTAKRIGLTTAPAFGWCEEISVPIVVGLLRPMILLPAAMIGGLSVHQLEAVLAHEMAHIRRFDLCVSLTQRLIESTFFFHPAVWLVSRQIDIEREKVADDIAIRAGCDPTEYADSLLRVAELSAELHASLSSVAGDSGWQNVSALAMTGNPQSGLRSRIVRLLGRDANQTIREGPTIPVVGATFVVVFLLVTTALTVNGDLPMKNDSADELSQAERDAFAAAIKANDVHEVEKLLLAEPMLANADLREAEHRDVFSHGHPLHKACDHNHAEVAALLLKHGADADGPGPDPDDRPVHGMPLHYAAAEHQNYRLANVLLDHGATPNSYPNCDKATIERMFYQAREAGVSDAIVRRSFAKYLPDRVALESQTTTKLAGQDVPEAIKLFARMVDLGGQPPFTALVREGFHDLLFEIIEHSQDSEGTPHDHPNSKVLDNIAGAARWYGYSQLVRRLMEHPSYQYDYGNTLSTISVAIGSHNRDGDYSKYREIIVMQLEALKKNGDLERAQKDPDFKPIYQLGTDFTWHENYGYRAEIATPECYVDLAELLVSWGFDDIDFRDAKTSHSPLSAAVKRGHHPGIATYVQWLLDKGADLRESDVDEVNPLSIAKEKGLSEIQQILQKHAI